MNIVVALDSFKGCLSSIDACHAATQGALIANPDASVHMIPLSDGGEGLTEILTKAMNGRLISVNVHGPLMDSITATYGIIEENDLPQTAIIEMAAACGLPLVPTEKRNPENTTTYGFGEMILDALHRGCKTLILGIGGSATNDAGIGMLQALGAKLKYDNSSQNRCKDNTPATGGRLSAISSIDTNNLLSLFEGISIQVACDVQNPLCGPQGAAYVFAPQKGADIDAVKRLDAGLQNIQMITGNTLSEPGDGAAGGLGFALRHFLHASMCPGIELILQQLRFDTVIADADLIITGEGKSDAQTLMGKVPVGVLNHAKQQNRPVILIAGLIEDDNQLLKSGFKKVICINNNDDAPLHELMKPDHAHRNISKTVSDVIRYRDGW